MIEFPKMTYFTSYVRNMFWASTLYKMDTFWIPALYGIFGQDILLDEYI